jgi:hypothetical protein
MINHESLFQNIALLTLLKSTIDPGDPFEVLIGVSDDEFQTPTSTEGRFGVENDNDQGPFTHLGLTGFIWLKQIHLQAFNSTHK